MGQIWSFYKIIVFSAIASFIFGAGFFISESAAQVALCNGKPVTIFGAPGNDFLKGTNGPDVIDAMGGHDIVVGENGDDTICAGDGRDFVFGGNGNDDIFAAGDRQKDAIDGGRGNDFCQVDERDFVVRCETIAEPYDISSP